MTTAHGSDQNDDRAEREAAARDLRVQEQQLQRAVSEQEARTPYVAQTASDLQEQKRLRYARERLAEVQDRIRRLLAEDDEEV